MRWLVLLLGIIIFGIWYINTHPIFSRLPAVTAVSTPKPASLPSPIQLASPHANDLVSPVFKVTGFARVFENQFSWRLKTPSGLIIASGSATAQSSDPALFAPFSFLISYPLPSTSNAILEVFDQAASDGAEIDLISLPLRLPSPPYSSYKLFFPSSSQDCSHLTAVPRWTTTTSQIALSAVKALLLGPTSTELFRYSQISNPFPNPSAQVNSVTINSGVATVDFSRDILTGMAGSCRVTAVTSALRATLLQFPSIKQVIITVNNQPVEFQP